MSALSSDDTAGSFGSDENPKPASQVVDDFHQNSDLDSRAEAQHHTLGSSATQASPGNHTHNGGDSALLLEGQIISGSRATDAWRISVNAILVRLGASDSSTP
jgi:anti-sigma factor ChrR (cupin superfamily)